MQPLKKSACANCGYVKPKTPKNEEVDVYCGLCDETFKKKDTKEHKKKEQHIIKTDVIKKIKELQFGDEQDKKKIQNISKTLTPMFTKSKNNNKME
jgi:hypothetical protein